MLLVRHATCAQTDSVLLGRTLDPPLSAAGETQAAALAQHLQPQRELLLHASPRWRTQQTAQAISQASGAPVMTTDSLDEMDFGAWSGQTFATLSHDPAWDQWNLQRACARTPAGDTMLGAQRRILDFIDTTLRVHPRRTLALVTHAEIIRAALLHYLRLGLDEYHRIQIDPASVSTVQLRADASVSVRVNELPAAWKHCA